MDTPTISRSGRLVKKSAKVKEMEDFDITDLETQGNKSRKKWKSSDDFEELDDKRIQPLKIPKISLNVPPTASTSYIVQSCKKRIPENVHTISKATSYTGPVKAKLDQRRPLFQESSPETSKDFGSSSESSESSSSSSSSSSSDDSEDVYNMKSRRPMSSAKARISPNLQKMPLSQERVIVEPYKQPFNSPLTFVDQNTNLAMYDSEEETSESNLVIAEESIDSPSKKQKERKGSAAKRKPVKKPIAKFVGESKRKVQRKKAPPAKNGKCAARRKSLQVNKDKKLSAYMLWCSENRKRVVSQNPVMFSSISKKLGEMWQALPEKEKMTWRRKAKKMAQKGAELISTGRPAQPSKAIIPIVSEGALQLSPEVRTNIGTAPIDVAAYLKLLGESLSIIGQRLTEHEGQIAVSGIFSVLLDSTLCALGPLLCLTSEVEELDGCPQPTLGKVLDNIAYFMPGL